MANLPPAGTGTEMYLAAILDKLAEIDQRIEQMAADAQAKPEPVSAEIVDLREPGNIGPKSQREVSIAVTRMDTSKATGEIDTGQPVHHIPDDFPGASHLRAAGVELVEEIPRDEKSLTAIPGIGKATAKAILEELGA